MTQVASRRVFSWRDADRRDPAPPGRRRVTAAAIVAVTLAGTVLGAAVVTAAGRPALPWTLASFVDTAASGLVVTADTLAPPTALAATGGASADLTWTATTSTDASGYELLRAATSGGPYGLVTTIAPATTTAAVDVPPASGTWYYVLRSALQGWRSVDSSEASAAVILGGATTGFRGCSTLATAADTGGDGNGYELLPGAACADDLLVASDVSTGTNLAADCANAGKDRHRFWDFDLGVPAAAGSIDGIEVRADVGMNNNGGTNLLCVELSWDGGASWTTARSVALGTSALTTYTLGGAADGWGRSWTGAELSDPTFRVRVTDATSQPMKTFLLEFLAVQVTYTP